jgi:hypothetical protein
MDGRLVLPDFVDPLLTTSALPMPPVVRQRGTRYHLAPEVLLVADAASRHYSATAGSPRRHDRCSGSCMERGNLRC